jgi:hypothetical protein
MLYEWLRSFARAQFGVSLLLLLYGCGLLWLHPERF